MAVPAPQGRFAFGQQFKRAVRQEAILNLANKLANKAPERQHPFGRSLRRCPGRLLHGFFSENCGFCLYSLFRRGITDRSFSPAALASAVSFQMAA